MITEDKVEVTREETTKDDACLDVLGFGGRHISTRD